MTGSRILQETESIRQRIIWVTKPRRMGPVDDASKNSTIIANFGRLRPPQGST